MENSENNPLSVKQTADGSPTIFSGRWNSAYHSKQGALAESTHVYINNGLAAFKDALREINVLEYGFGTGLNALQTLKFSQENSLKIRYQTIELFPPGAALLEQVYSFLSGEDSKSLQPLHNCEWDCWQDISKQFVFKKHLCDFKNVVINQQIDLIYYDTFAPRHQPELWTEESLLKVYDKIKPGGFFVTYCACSALKKTMRQAGATVQTLMGPPPKREMTRVIKPF